MYLISIYFDSESNHRIMSFMNKIADLTGNQRMTDGDVPPHITISSFDAREEEKAKEAFLRLTKALEREQMILKKQDTMSNELAEVFFASIGSFPTGALFLAPVLDESLHHLQELAFASLSIDSGLKISRQYRPFSWFPHATLAKKLDQRAMTDAFAQINKDFSPFRARVLSIGLAKTNPFTDILRIDF